jgi:hypothetical protein
VLIPDKIEPISCAYCGHEDFQLCACPWGKTFDEWPARMTSNLWSRVDDNPFAPAPESEAQK